MTGKRLKLKKNNIYKTSFFNRYKTWFNIFEFLKKIIFELSEK